MKNWQGGKLKNLSELWFSKYKKKDTWRDRSLNNYIESLVDLEVKEIIKSSLSGTIPVALYGKSQVGKTTFLLKLIGIKDECLLNIHDILRCGSKPGNAATPTAMIYKRTPDSNFKVHYATHKKEFNDESGIREELIKIREMVESQSLEQVDEIVIEIPYFYFNKNDFNIQVCDLPGIESSNEKERPHVERIIKRFIPLSALILVFQIGNDINDVSNLFNNSVMSEIYGWKYMATRYRLIITRAYSAQSVVENIKSDKLKLTENDIRGFYRTQANNDSSNINNVPDQVKIFAFELGDSLKNELPNKYLETELLGINEVMENFWKEIFNDIKITSQTGNVLKRISVIPFLLQKLIDDKQEKLNEIMELFNSKINEKELLIKSLETNNNNLFEELNKSNNEIRYYQDKVPYFSKLNCYEAGKNRELLLNHLDTVIKGFVYQLNYLFSIMPFNEKDDWDNEVNSIFSIFREDIRKLKFNKPILGIIGGPDQKHIDMLNFKINELNNLIDKKYNPEINRIKAYFIELRKNNINIYENKKNKNFTDINKYKIEKHDLTNELNIISLEYNDKINSYKKELEQKSDIIILMRNELSKEIELIKNELNNKNAIDAFLDLMYVGLIIKEYEKQTIFN